jgi:hypothetical protein
VVVATTFPVVAPVGTETEILVSDQHVLQGVAAVPLNVIVLVPWLVPKPEPLIVTELPIGPEVIDRPVMLGAAWAALLKTSMSRTASKDFPTELHFSEIIGAASRDIEP